MSGMCCCSSKAWGKMEIKLIGGGAAMGREPGALLELAALPLGSGQPILVPIPPEESCHHCSCRN